MAHAISTSRFERGRLLGEGSVGKTYLVHERATRSTYVFTTVRAPVAHPDEAAATLERLISVVHPRLLRPHGYAPPNARKQRPLAICAPYLANGSLAALLSATPRVPDLQRVKVLFAAAEALRHLHALGICHSALTPANVLFDAQMAAVVADYGRGALRCGPGTPFSDRGVNESLDVFCFGVIVYCVFAGDPAPPFPFPPLPADFPAPFRELVRECCAEDAAARPSMEAIVVRFLRKQLTLPLAPPELAELYRFEGDNLAPSFAVRALLAAALEINALSDENRSLSSRIAALTASVHRLGQQHVSASMSTGFIPLPGPPPAPPPPAPGPVKLGSVRRIGAFMSTPHAFDFFAIDFADALRDSAQDDHALAQVRAQIASHPSNLTLAMLQGAGAPPAESPLEARDYGICARLAEQYGGNPAEMGIVIIRGNSCDPGRELMLPRLIDYTWDKCWTSRNEPRSWITFDFGSLSMEVRKYWLKTYPVGKGFSHLQSWVLQASGDGGANWEDLDRRESLNDLNGKSKTALYRLRQPTNARLFRLMQIGPNHGGDHYLILTNIDFYGEMFSED
jgi:hypothetical protein